MNRILLRSAMAALFFVWLPHGATRAATNKYVESFNATTYKDAANTTALWETSTGELKLAPFVPSLVGAYDTPDLAFGVAVSGDLAFVADQSGGLRIINITNPASPSLVGTYDTPGTALGVAVAGDLAFVADYASGLKIINIANPASPTLVGTYDTPGGAYYVAVAGDLAFVADGPSGLQIINIINPASPSLVGTYDTPGLALGVAVDGDLAFVADHTGGLRIINITNPASPSLTGTYLTPGFAYGVAVDGDLAFVADYTSGLEIIDIANPASPSLAGSYDTPAVAYRVAVAGDFAFVADYISGLQIIDITNPGSPILASTYSTVDAAYDVAVAGDLAFVADYGSGLQIIDTAAGGPGPFPLVGAYATPGWAMNVAVAGDLAFVVDPYSPSGFEVINIANPHNPSLVGTYSTEYPSDVAVAGDLAFMAEQLRGLLIINITNPASPTLVGTYDTPGPARGVAVAGDLAFVADYTNGLQIINTTNPASPTLVGTYNTPGTAEQVAVAGNLAFVADYEGGLQIINITNPASPSLVGTYSTVGVALDVAVAGDLAFVASASGLLIINITNPASPSLVGAYEVTPAQGVAVAGDLAFMAAYEDGLHVINITNPALPTLDAKYDTPGNAYSIAAAGGLALVADLQSGLQIIEAFNHEFYARANSARSLKVNTTTYPIIAARVSATQAPTVTWEISANGGANWQAIATNVWSAVTTGGNDLRWRSTHSQTSPGVNPKVSDLQIEWRHEFSLINAITDIPNDQGGWVRLKLIASGRDLASEASLPIVNYGVWRRVSSAALLAEIASAPRSTETIDPSIREAFGALPVFGHGGDVFVQSAPGELNATLPPGTWALVANIPALQQDAYLADISTLADSTSQGPNYTVFVVTAHTTTPSIWYASPVDSGYSKDNIAPGVPTSFAVAYNTGSGNTLSWDPSLDYDFQYFHVYRSNSPSFPPTPGTLVHSSASHGWVDPSYHGGGVYYEVTALDYAGNESGPAVAGSVTAVGGVATPSAFALYANVPNPFNPTTVIRYDVPKNGGEVSLRIYDAAGRVVKTLVAGTLAAGQRAIAWDGHDDAGRPVASGVYFCRLTASGYASTRKMVLLK
jgi:hypothetical protein